MAGHLDLPLIHCRKKQLVYFIFIFFKNLLTITCGGGFFCVGKKIAQKFMFHIDKWFFHDLFTFLSIGDILDLSKKYKNIINIRINVFLQNKFLLLLRFLLLSTSTSTNLTISALYEKEEPT